MRPGQTCPSECNGSVCLSDSASPRVKTDSDDQDAEESNEDTVRHRSPRSRGSGAEAYSLADSGHIGIWSFKLLRCEFYCRFDPVRRCEPKARTTPGKSVVNPCLDPIEPFCASEICAACPGLIAARGACRFPLVHVGALLSPSLFRAFSCA